MVASFARARSVALATSALLVGFAAAGCSAKDEMAKELDRLRVEVATLRSQTSALSERLGAAENAARGAGAAHTPARRPAESAAGPNGDRPALAVVKLGPDGASAPVVTESTPELPPAVAPASPPETSASTLVFSKAKGLFDRRQIDQAQLALGEFLSQFPDHEKVPEATFLRAQCYALKGDKKRSAEQLEAALAMSGGTDMAADVLFELAKAREKLGDPAAAKRARDRLRTEHANSAAAKRLSR